MSTKIKSGLVSVTFRKLSPQQIIDAATSAGLEAIEWGGDVHVPHGDVAAARRVRSATTDAGLAISAYGSYYRAGTGSPPDWPAVLDSASALETDTIRVWAGNIGSAAASAEVRNEVIDDLARIADAAAVRDLRVSMEYHANTLTDTLDSTLDLLRRVNRPNLVSAWQPRHGVATETSVAEIDALRPHLSDLHVFHWWPDNRTRLPLADGVDRWRPFLRAASDAAPRYAMLEFVRNDDPAQLAADAASLRSWISEL